jgi:hypothetical protein
LLLINFLAISNFAFAQALRCKGKIIKVGDSKYYVLQKCGEPAHIEPFTDPSPWGAKTGEKLYYESRGRTFIVEVRQGEVKAIEVERK